METGNEPDKKINERIKINSLGGMLNDHTVMIYN